MLLALALLAALQWAALTLLVARAWRKLPRLEQREAAPPPCWPSVSLIAPAKDEGTHVEGAVRSKLALDYPALQVVLVDDRSTDETGAIADRLAATDARLTVVHVRELPDGWLGKVHALERGIEQANGEWLLLSDADVHFGPEMLRRAVAYAQERQLDFLVALPTMVSSSPAVATCMASFLRVVSAALQADWIADPSARSSLGAGIFALVRRAAYERSPGLAHLRLEVADDLAFGTMMKRSGARCGVVLALDHLRLEMYRDLSSVVRGTAKGAPAIGRYRLVPQLLIPLVPLAFAVAPAIALGLGAARGEAWLSGVGAAGLALQMASSAIALSLVRGGTRWALLAPLGDVFMFSVILVTGLAAHARGGIEWRSTFYPLAALRGAMRFRWPWER